MTALPIPDGVADWAWHKIARADGERWAIAERNAQGEVIGTAYRDADGRKTFKPGGKRGLIVAWPLDAYAGSAATTPVFVCEGASDTAALLGLELDAVGVPMAGHCGAILAELLAARHVVIVADADDAGRRGAQKIADVIGPRCGSVRIIEPPEGAKDARAAVVARADRATFLSLAGTATPWTPTPAPLDGAPVLVRLSNVNPEPVAWLWPGRFALGKLTLIAGDPGLGKSLLTLDMASRVSTGAGWPDRRGERPTPGGVVLLSAEDDVADTIRPRLDAAGADVSRIVALQGVRFTIDASGKQAERAFDLGADLPALERAIRSVEGCRLVVIDPVTAYLGGVDSHKNADVRGLLAPLGELARQHRVAVVAVTHLRKGDGQAIYRAMGSLGFIAAARAAWAVSRDRDNPRRRLFLPMKNNNAPDTGGLAFTFQSVPGHDQPALAWEADPVTVSADDALAGDRDDAGGRTERDDAAAWLRDYLGDGPKLARDVLTESKAAGFSKRTIDRAKPVAGVRTRKEAFGGGWVWELGAPGEERQPDAEGCHTPDVGNLGQKPDESRETHPNIATPEGLATFDLSGGNLGSADTGDGWEVV